MLTTPDGNDAAPTLPPISAPGPHPNGFFADCNPAQGFDGTRPLAEHFNELIVNLRALLAAAGVPGVKADPTMLWRAVLLLRVVSDARTLNVALTGTASPTNPWGGAAFNSLGAALAFLQHYRIGLGGSVTINIAAGTYPAAMVTVAHPDGARLTIRGAGSATTILQGGATDTALTFRGSTLAALEQLQLRGDGVSATSGIYATGAVLALKDVLIDRFAGHGLIADTSQIAGTGPLTITNSGGVGLWLVNSHCDFTPRLTVSNSGSATGGNILASGGVATLLDVVTTGGQRGIVVHNNGALALGVANIGAVTVAADALVCSQSAYLTGWQQQANAWTFAAGGGVRASQNGFIAAGNNLPAGAAASPARDTLGNQGGYISTQPLGPSA